MMNVILGVDIAKDKFDCCLLLEEHKPQHARFANARGGFQSLLRWIKKAGADPAQTRACMEATGTYGQNLAAFLFERKIRVSVVNPAQIKYYAKSRLARNKTDRLDALIIARFCQSENPRLWSPPAPEIFRLRAIHRLMQARKDQLAQERTRLVTLPKFLRKTSRPLIGFLQKQIQALQEQIEAILRQNPELAQKRALLCSIPGVGRATAQSVLAELPPDIASLCRADSRTGGLRRNDRPGPLKQNGKSRVAQSVLPASHDRTAAQRKAQKLERAPG
jgi:transposase